VTWTVVQDDTGPPPRPVIADFMATSYMPVDDLPITEASSEVIEPPIEVIPPVPIERSPSMPIDPTWAVIDASMAARDGDREQAAGFAGARATNARSIVYVIDASGSMITWLTMVLEALSQSLDRLDASQRYAVMFFQGDEVITVPPARLQSARQRNIRNTTQWTRQGANLMPGGGSNPLPALQAALELQPDVIFLLSEGLQGPRGDLVDQSAVLTSLDELNPIADPVTGRRWTTIQCIQVSNDAMEAAEDHSLLKSIADRHGGPDGWTSLGRSDLIRRSGADQ